MVAKRQGETASDLRSVQREREREKRRMRDRQRRQNMSLEQRERHLARRRRNYQLRRIRAEKAKLGDHHQNHNPNSAESQENVVNLTVYNASGTDLRFSGLQITEKSVSTIEDVAGGESGKKKKKPRRLRMYQIRQLARLLNAHVNELISAADDANPSENCSISSKQKGCNKTLRLTHIKRLARALKSGNK